MLQNAYLLAKIGVDTAENERKFDENLPKTGRRRPHVPDPHGRGGHAEEPRVPVGDGVDRRPDVLLVEAPPS